MYVCMYTVVCTCGLAHQLFPGAANRLLVTLTMVGHIVELVAAITCDTGDVLRGLNVCVCVCICVNICMFVIVALAAATQTQPQTYTQTSA